VGRKRLLASKGGGKLQFGLSVLHVGHRLLRCLEWCARCVTTASRLPLGDVNTGGGCQVPWPGGRIEGLRSSSVRLPALDLHPRLCRTSGTSANINDEIGLRPFSDYSFEEYIEDRRALFRARASPSSIGATTVSCSPTARFGEYEVVELPVDGFLEFAIKDGTRLHHAGLVAQLSAPLHHSLLAPL
jgi:hypothetical protein